MGGYQKKTRNYRRRNKKTNKYFKKRKRKGFRKTRKQKAGNANLINAAAAAAASAAALGAGLYFMGNRRSENDQEENPYGPLNKPEYIESPFIGPKSGYVYQNGKLGVGYYKDTVKVSEHGIMTRGTGCNGRSDDYRYITDTGSVSTLDYLLQDGFSHKIYEQGTAGDCFYCCYAAALNDMYRKQGFNKRVSMKQLRDDVANEISETEGEEEEDKLKIVYAGEYEDWNDSIKYVKNKLIRSTKDTKSSNRRQGGQYDAIVLSQKYNVGVIFVSVKDGTVVCIDSSDSYPYYALILWDTSRRHENNKDPEGRMIEYNKLETNHLNHYRSLAIRSSDASRDQPYDFVIQCNKLPNSIKDRAKICSNMKTGCPRN